MQSSINDSSGECDIPDWEALIIDLVKGPAPKVLWWAMLEPGWDIRSVGCKLTAKFIYWIKLINCKK